MIKIRDSHITQPWLRISKQRENMPQCRHLMHDKKNESNIIKGLSPTQNPTNVDIPSMREKPNASKSVSHKRKHSNDSTSTNLHKPVQVKAVKDNAWSYGLRVVWSSPTSTGIRCVIKKSASMSYTRGSLLVKEEIRLRSSDTSSRLGI